MKTYLLKIFKPVLTGANLTRRLDWLILLRWFAGIGVIIAVLAGKAFFHIEQVGWPLSIGILILFYNAVFYWLNRRPQQRALMQDQNNSSRIKQINYQIVIDLFTLVCLIHFTGGILNPFLFFFVFHMVIGSILLSRPNAYAIALFTILMVTITFALEHFNFVDTIDFFKFYPEGLAVDGLYVLLLLAAFSATMIITVYFTTNIVDSIRQKHLKLTDLQKDLQDQKEQLEEKNRELEALDHSKTEFLYRVEHELKAPIEAVNSILSVVSRGYSSVSEEKRDEFIKRASNRVLSMKELVSDLLSMSRIKERTFKLDKREIRADDIVTAIVNDMRGPADKKGIAIQLEIESGLPKLTADENAFRDIARNLIHNAVKYSFEGTVTVSMYVKNENIALQVRDQGIGIDPADLEKIGEEFYRTGNARAFEEGTGLGLSLVKKLVEKHGGKFDVQSQLNKGSTFTVSFPRVNNYFSAL
jgi:two-component system phosphate regulon sensor histidine kinase PhoR